MGNEAVFGIVQRRNALKLRYLRFAYNQVFENNADSHFHIKIGGTIYDVTTHYDPKGRQCVLEQFKDLLLQKDWSQPHNRKEQPKSI